MRCANVRGLPGLREGFSFVFLAFAVVFPLGRREGLTHTDLCAVSFFTIFSSATSLVSPGFHGIFLKASALRVLFVIGASLQANPRCKRFLFIPFSVHNPTPCSESSFSLLLFPAIHRLPLRRLVLLREAHLALISRFFVESDSKVLHKIGHLPRHQSFRSARGVECAKQARRKFLQMVQKLIWIEAGPPAVS